MQTKYSREIRQLLTDHAKLPTAVEDLDDQSDLYHAGLTSLTTVHLMLAIEDHFDIEFEDDMLGRSAFQTIAALDQAIQSLTS